jgi:5'-nucleotidase
VSQGAPSASPRHLIRKAAIALALVAGLLPVVALASPALAVGENFFISEFHYDNSGADAGEFVEVTGDAGDDLAGWSIVLYNGNGGASYNTINLSASPVVREPWRSSSPGSRTDLPTGWLWWTAAAR